MSAVASSDELFAPWMRGNLDQAATRLGLRVVSEPVLGWRQRPIGAGSTVRTAHAG